MPEAPPARVTVSIDVDEERIRAIVREEIAAAPASTGMGTALPSSSWMTPPAAAKACDVSLYRVQELMRGGGVMKRPKNLDAANAKQIKWEVNVESLRAALNGEPARPMPKLLRGG